MFLFYFFIFSALSVYMYILLVYYCTPYYILCVQKMPIFGPITWKSCDHCTVNILLCAHTMKIHIPPMKRIRNWLSIIDSQSTETECTRSNAHIYIHTAGFIGNECMDRGQTAMPIADSYVRYTCVLIAVIRIYVYTKE